MKPLLYSINLACFITLMYTILTSCSVVKTDFATGNQKTATVYYYLPETLLKIHATAKVAVIYEAQNNTLSASPELLELNFAITTETIADTRALLSLNYKPNALMTDEIKYSVNNKGLLQTVDVKTDDRTSEIISKLADAPKTVLGLATGTRAANTFAKLKEFTADFTIKASDVTAAGITIPWLIPITNEIKSDNFALADGSFTVSTNSPIVNPAPTVPSLLPSATSNEVDGILTRPLVYQNLSFQSTLASAPGILPIRVPVADVSKLITVPVRRTAFAKRETKITMADGLVLGHDIKNPSAIEGFVSIPINLAKAIVAVPGQLVTFRIDNTKRLNDLEKEKLILEKTLQDAQKFSLSKEMELEKVKLEIQKASASNEYALKIMKFDLDRALLESEKKQLEALQALEQIKAEIEKLKKP